jgi:hypothetical protein
MIKKLVNRFGILITASFFIMAIGIVTFLLVIPLYHFFRIDTDIIGLIIITIGLVLLLVGIIRRYKPHGFKLVILVILASLLCIPTLSLIASLIYYLITGKPLGN